MFIALIMYSAIVFFVYAFWYYTTSFFITLFSTQAFSFSYKPPYFTKKALFFHFLLVCFWFFFALFLTNMQFFSFSQIITQMPDILFACLFLFCVCVHILSILDYKFLCVPNLLLSGLFAISLCFYYSLYGFYSDFSFNDYPFMILGMAYGFYFLLHLFLSNEILGLGDIWVFVGISIILESLFNQQAQGEIIFEFLFSSSLLAILFHLFLFIKKKKGAKDNTALENYKKENIQESFTKQDSKDLTTIYANPNMKLSNKIHIPFIPFLVMGFILVSVWHAC